MAKDVDRAVQRRLGARIRTLRAARKLTQETIADRVDLSQKYVSELERGQRSPSWGTLMAIAHHGFEIKLASLMFGIDEDIDVEVQDLSDVLAGWPQEARRDMLRAVVLLLRAAGGVRGDDRSSAVKGAGSGRTAAAADAARARRRVASR